MLNIQLTGDCAGLEAGVAYLMKTNALSGAEGSLSIKVSRLAQGDPESLTCTTAGGAHIAYRRRCDFFHALMLLTENLDTPDYAKSRTERFSQMHAMVDVSRNAVYTVSEMERFLCRLALTGYTGCLMYMEDTFPLPDYPYFGYMRGRYTRDELIRLNACAESLGIELLPCIQTLAHLRMPLRWSYAAGMRDTDDTLLVGEEKTYAFIEAMFRELSGIFTSRRIHIGMDEAKMVGRGKYLALHGLKPQREIMLDHIQRVAAIASKYALTPMMWDDMLYRNDNDSGMAYFTSGVTLSPEEISRLPHDMQYVYWDYYKASTEEYDPQMTKRRSLPTIFAGASWKWNGWVPCYDKSFATGRAAIEACLRHGIDEVMLTLWADDGAETPLIAALPSILLYGESRFEDASDEVIDRRCRLLCAVGLTAFRAIENIELLPDLKRPNLNCINSAKQLLYCDLMQGLFDAHYADDFIPRHYAQSAIALKEEARSAPEEMRPVLNLYACLARVLAAKAPLGNALHKAYRAGDRARLSILADEIISLKELVRTFHASVASVWSASCKGSGLEVLDIRLGGLAGRCETVARRIRCYLEGDLTALDELDQDVLPFGNFWPEGEKYPSYNPYSRIASANSGI